MAWKHCEICNEDYNDKLPIPHDCLGIPAGKLGMNAYKNLAYRKERKARIMDMFDNWGWSFGKICKYFKITRQRAHVIYHLPLDHYEKLEEKKRKVRRGEL
jgi:hypothetical protein